MSTVGNGSAPWPASCLSFSDFRNGLLCRKRPFTTHADRLRPRLEGGRLPVAGPTARRAAHRQPLGPRRGAAALRRPAGQPRVLRRPRRWAGQPGGRGPALLLGRTHHRCRRGATQKTLYVCDTRASPIRLCCKRPFATDGRWRLPATAAVCRIPCRILCLADGQTNEPPRPVGRAHASIGVSR